MKTQVLTGRFLKSDGTPYEGEISFTPRDLWVEEDGITWARLAPIIQLEDGRFTAEVSIGRYIVDCPVGRWKVRVRDTNGVGYLSDHIPSRFR